MKKLLAIISLFVVAVSMMFVQVSATGTTWNTSGSATTEAVDGGTKISITNYGFASRSDAVNVKDFSMSFRIDSLSADGGNWVMLGLMNNAQILPNTATGLALAFWGTSATTANIHVLPSSFTSIGASFSAETLAGQPALTSGIHTLKVKFETTKWVVTVDGTDTEIGLDKMPADFFTGDKAYVVFGGNTPDTVVTMLDDANSPTTTTTESSNALTPVTVYNAQDNDWTTILDVNETKGDDGVRVQASDYSGISTYDEVNAASFAVEFTVNDFSQSGAQWFYMGLCNEDSIFPNTSNSVPSLYAAYWANNNNFNIHYADGYKGSVETAFGTGTLLSTFSMDPANGGLAWKGQKHRLEIQYVEGIWYVTVDGKTNTMNLNKTPEELFTDGKAYFVLGGTVQSDITINSISLQRNTNTSDSVVTGPSTTTESPVADDTITTEAITEGTDSNVQTGSTLPVLAFMVTVFALGMVIITCKHPAAQK